MPGIVKDIVMDLDAPDRDLFVYDTEDESLLAVVSGVGTLLYGLAVGSRGRAFVAHTEARNAADGMDGGALVDLLPREFARGVHRQPLLGLLASTDGPTGNPPLPFLTNEPRILLPGIEELPFCVGSVALCK